jgi:hypothetical protein
MVVVAVHQGVLLRRIEKPEGLVPDPVLESQEIQGGVEGMVVAVKVVDLLEGESVYVEGDMEWSFAVHDISWVRLVAYV